MIEDDMTPEIGQPLLDACDKFPYHELVAYSCGHSIGELTDWLRRGAVAGPETHIGHFAREYSRRDADYAARSWEKIEGLCDPDSKGGNTVPILKWFERRWPVENPISIAGILASEETEQLSMVESFMNPNAPVKQALDACRYFRAEDLLNPGPELQRALAAAGLARREVAGDQPLPGTTPEV